MLCPIRIRWFCWLALTGAGTAAAEFDARIKWFGTASAFPEHDIQRQLDATPAYDHNVDLRLMFKRAWSGLSVQIEHSTTYVAGDSLAFSSAPGTTLDQAPTDDDRRMMDLTWNIDSGDRHQALHRLDRLAVKYRTPNWGFTLGREAVTWGSGLVFQPMDLFNPFAPTTVDRDYKAGDDLFLAERLFSDGSDLQLLLVGRRDADGDFTGQAGSAAAKWRSFVGGAELELLAARHIADQVYGAAVRWPLGGAMVRSDLVATRLREGDWELSMVVNIDYSLALAGHTSYLFAEYFHSDFGVHKLPDTPAELPAPLRQRLERGELFNLMRDYLAVGGTIEWHPLWSQSLTVIANLTDGSSLVQSQLTYEPGDHQRLEFGAVLPLGSRGQEFGGIPVAQDALTGAVLTTGGGLRGYLRWVYYL
jgi:hypothetical protein